LRLKEHVAALQSRIEEIEQRLGRSRATDLPFLPLGVMLVARLQEG